MCKILITCRYYLPGYKAGGPIRTIQAITDRLGDEFPFFILTGDRDYGDINPFADVRYGDWNFVGKSRVRYLASHERTVCSFYKLLNRIPYDLIYLNSFQDPVFTVQILMLRWLGLIPHRPVVVAPRGEFSPGALKLASARLRVFLCLSRLMGLYSDVYWQASSAQESDNIVTNFLNRFVPKHLAPRILVAPDLVPMYNENHLDALIPKEKGSLRVVFLSRISPMKNLEFAIKAISGLVGKVTLDIYGPLNDTPYEQTYWEDCRELLQSLTANITAHYHGSVNPSEVHGILAAHDLFILPTLGENFGHVILEALSSGCPVLISDRTPWHDLAAKHAGWDIPLEQPEVYKKILQSLVDMDQTEIAIWHEGALAYAQRYIADDTSVSYQRQLFLTALGGSTQ